MRTIIVNRRIPHSLRYGREMQALVITRSFSTQNTKTRSKDEKVKFEIERKFKTHKCQGPDNFIYSTGNELLQFFKQMSYYRRFEIMADQLYKARMIRGFCHLYDGQEAVVTGMEAAIRRTDSVITAYRCHCNQLARGDSGGRVLAELMGKFTGSSKGKGGSMHLYYPKGHFYGGNGIVGAQVPIGTGLAFAHKYRKDGGIAVAMYGDGAANQGQFFEAANMAALWKVPVIFVCENNNYGMGTSTKRAAANTNFYTRGDIIPGLWVDGMDVLASKKGFEYAAEYCRNGNGPIVLELATYRYHGHSMSDPGISYRTREEINQMRAEKDCIENLRQKILKNNMASEEELKDIEKEVKKMVDDDAEFAKNSPEPPLDQVLTDIYVDEPTPVARTVEFNQSIERKQ